MRSVNQFAVLQEKGLGFSSVKCFAFQICKLSFYPCTQTYLCILSDCHLDIFSSLVQYTL